jgi:hypothetical protein
MVILLAEMKKMKEVKKEDMEAKQWKKKGGQILKGSKTVTYNIISSEKSKII